MATATRQTRPISRAYMERKVKFKSYDAQRILRDFARLAFSMYRLGIRRLSVEKKNINDISLLTFFVVTTS